MLPGALTPPWPAHLSRLGSRLSFADAASELGPLKGVTVAPATVRRRTETDGALYAALQDAAAARVVATAPRPPAGPAVQQVSVDGTMVHLTAGSWREGRTLAMGTVEPGRRRETVRSTQISSFARLADAATFTELAAGRCTGGGWRRRASWPGWSMAPPGAKAFSMSTDRMRCASSTSPCRPAPPAAQRLGDVAEAVWGEGPAASAWAAAQRRALADGAAAMVLAAIRALPVVASRDPATAAQVQTETLGYLEPRLPGTAATWNRGYLEPRQDQLRSAAFRAQGLPIGSGMVESGMVESGNKLVVGSRLRRGGGGPSTTSRRWWPCGVPSAPSGGGRRGGGLPGRGVSAARRRPQRPSSLQRPRSRSPPAARAPLQPSANSPGADPS